LKIFQTHGERKRRSALLVNMLNVFKGLGQGEIAAGGAVDFRGAPPQPECTTSAQYIS